MQRQRTFELISRGPELLVQRLEDLLFLLPTGLKGCDVANSGSLVVLGAPGQVLDPDAIERTARVRKDEGIPL